MAGSVKYSEFYKKSTSISKLLLGKVNNPIYKDPSAKIVT